MAMSSPSPAASPEVERLTMLLQKAADAIRAERAKFDSLRSENEALQERIRSLEGQLQQQGGASNTSRMGGGGGGPQEVLLLRQQLQQIREDYRLLGMENDIAVGQIANLREENARLHMLLQSGHGAAGNHNRSATGTNGAYATAASGQPARRPASPQPSAVGRSASAASRPSTARSPSNAPPLPTGGTIRSSSPGAASAGGQQRRTHSSDLYHRLQAKQRGNASVGAVMHNTSGGGGQGGVNVSGCLHPGGSHPPVTFAWHPSGSAPSIAASGFHRTASAAGTSTYAYDRTDQALNRLRRSMAPPPTKEQLDEVIKAMVAEIQSQLGRKGMRLPMRRVKECCYESGKKRFNLSVDSNRLMVKCGGGNVDFLEYIDRHKLCE